ncbi:MAG: hypothetical protein ACI9HK_005029 [Pirellulaceae bacterium]|jgi:uncharacterized protein
MSSSFVTIETKRDQLLASIAKLESCAVAFSAGVDSTVVAKAAQLALGDSAIAVTGTSASLASGELEQAKELAEIIGIEHIVIETQEFNRQQYTANQGDRCYFCKTELYSNIDSLQRQRGFRYVLNGANVDDLGDYRPGMKAAAEFEVLSPLAECGFNKQDIRDLACFWELPVWDKPATPCLSSRVAYGEEVTPQRLKMIDVAEQFLRAEGFEICRVRYHRGDLARLEVPRDRIGDLIAIHDQVGDRLKGLGFRFITIDLEGFRSGSLNQLVVKRGT